MMIKYDADGNVLWGARVGGTSSEEINSIEETSDGGIVVGGYFYSDRIELENEQVLENKNFMSNGVSWNDGMIIKYDADGNALWGARVGGARDDKINDIVETRDGGIVVGGEFSSTIELDNGQVLEKNR